MSLPADVHTRITFGKARVTIHVEREEHGMDFEVYAEAVSGIAELEATETETTGFTVRLKGLASITFLPTHEPASMVANGDSAPHGHA